jgi:hypothetical protein
VFSFASIGLSVLQSSPSSSEVPADPITAVSDTLAASAVGSDSLAVLGTDATAVSPEETGQVLEKIVASLPTDPASILALVLLLGCTILVLRYGLQKGPTEKKPSERE